MQNSDRLHISISGCAQECRLIAVSGLEKLSNLFAFDLSVVSHEPINGGELLGKNVQFQIGKSCRSGLIQAAVTNARLVDGMNGLVLKVVPWLWWLTQHQDCRAFCDKSVPEIMMDILSHYSFADYCMRFHETYSPRNFCVQYNESDFEFLSRILHEEGIIYFFEYHVKDRMTRHVLVMTDDIAAMPIYQKKIRSDRIWGWQIQSSAQANALNSEQHRAETNISEWMPGMRFSLDHQHYYLVELIHSARDYAQLPSSTQIESPQSLHNRLIAIKVDQGVFCGKASHFALSHGPQTAVVSAGALHELHADRLGRLKVHFHWMHDQRSSMQSNWVRCNQHWAGRFHGQQFIPRVGQEVLVDFINGDIASPIILGEMPNSNNPVLFALPKQALCVGMKTFNGNSIKFSDAKNDQRLALFAKRNLCYRIKRDWRCEVRHHYRLIVAGDCHTKILQGEYVLQAALRISLRVGASRIDISEEGIEIQADTVFLNGDQK